VIFSENLNKPIVKKIKKDIDLNNSNQITIGKSLDFKDSFYYGFIDFLQIYDDELPLNKINFVIDEINNRSKVQNLKKRNTVDKRDCITACSAEAIPGEPGSSSPPKDADPCKINKKILKKILKKY